MSHFRVRFSICIACWGFKPFGCFVYPYIRTLSGNIAGRVQKLRIRSPVLALEMYAIGGSVSIYAMAHVSLTNVKDRQSFVTMEVAQNTEFPRNVSAIRPEFLLYFLSLPFEKRFVINSIGGSMYISSRLSTTFLNVNIEACSAFASYDGTSGSSLTAIGGAAALMSSTNPFARPRRSWFSEPSRVSLISSTFNGNNASCTRNIALNSNTSVLTVMGGAVSVLHSDLFLPPSSTVGEETYQNHNQIVTISGSIFSNNSAVAAYPKKDSFSDLSIVFQASAVVLGGSL